MVLVGVIGIITALRLWVVAGKQDNYYLRTTAYVSAGMAGVLSLITLGVGLNMGYFITPPVSF